jgi:hypothetical protein
MVRQTHGAVITGTQSEAHRDRKQLQVVPKSRTTLASESSCILNIHLYVFSVHIFIHQFSYIFFYLLDCLCGLEIRVSVC